MDARGSVLGLGPTAQVPISRASPSESWTEELTRISVEGDGPAPRLHAALPFHPDEDAIGLLPSVQITGVASGYWVTTIAESDAGHLDLDAMLESVAEAPATPELPALVGLEQVPPASGFESMVETALQEIDAGTLSKVVLSRSVRLDADADLDPLAVIDRMAEREPTCTLFSMPGDGWRFVGASPELLVSVEGRGFRSLPLAGTVSRSADAQADLLGSAKNAEEHRLVVEDIAARIAPLLDGLVVPEQPSVVTLRAVSHLGTEIVGRVAGDASSIDLLMAIHPTPAIAGVPRGRALEAIESIEVDSRGLFGGAIGWVDAAGDGAWVLGIRGAFVNGRKAIVRAGAGIVAGSQPHDEAMETKIKMLSILDAIAPGCAALL